VTTVFVTGAEGFIGSRLCERLRTAGHRVIGGIRGSGGELGASHSCVRIDIGGFRHWGAALEGVDVVVHLAARAHRIGRREGSRLDEFRRINVDATAELFRACSHAAVRRFLFVSSIGVHGASTDSRPFREADPANPTEPYAQSKWEAEQALHALAAEEGPELVIVRPALVYGPGAKGNFRRLMRLIGSGWPLPFASIRARRNYLGLDNLCALLELCALDARAAGETFVAADPWSVDLPTLLRTLAQSMGLRLRLWPAPPFLLRAGGRLLGLSAELARLTSPLEIDSGKARGLLQWRPEATFLEGIDQMARSFLDARGSCS
jgi:nucleoside-diphosphate-sugar epimerase